MSRQGEPRVQAASDMLQAIIGKAALDPAVPGVIATVSAPHQGLEWTGSAGGRHPGGSGPPPEPDTPFRIASITKSFVAAALFRLAEQGALRLHAPIAALISKATQSQLLSAGYDAGAITVRHLLTHTGGLRDHLSPDYAAAVSADPQHVWTRQEQIAFSIRLGGPLSEPGKVFCYSDTGFILLGEIIEQVSDQPLAMAVRRLVGFEALGLSRTWWEAEEQPPEACSGRLPQYLVDVDTHDWHPSFDLFGGGGLVSTTRDLARGMRALVRGSIFERRETIAAALWVPEARRAEGAFLHSGLAMDIPAGRFGGWGHAGFWGSAAVHVPDIDLTIALTLNQAAPADSALLRHLTADLVRAAMTDFASDT